MEQPTRNWSPKYTNSSCKLSLKKRKVFSFYLLFGNWNLLKYFRAPPRSFQSRYWLGLQAVEVLMNRGSLSSSLTGLLVGFASTQDIIQRIPEIPCYMGPWRSRAQHGSWVLSTKREREKQQEESQIYLFTLMPGMTSQNFFLIVIIESLCAIQVNGQEIHRNNKSWDQWDRLRSCPPYRPHPL